MNLNLRMMMNKIVFVLFNLFFSVSIFAQTVDEYFERQAANDFEKLYMSTDREFCFIGDTLWFSPYIIDARSQYLSTDEGNLYVDLINDQGELIEEKNFLLNQGTCSGYLFLDNKVVRTGNYILRAYTDRMKPLGNEYFFKKTIKVNESRLSNNRKDTIADDTKKINLDFYPEGGFLLEGAVNQMAFVARNQNGKRVSFDGELQSSDGALIKVKTDYNGTGSFLFVPRPELKYTIVSENNKRLHYRMPEFRKHGAKIMVLKTTHDDVSILLTTSEKLQDQNYYLAVLHRGEGLNYFKFDKKQLLQPIYLKTDHFAVGIHRLVLLNENFEPLSERLIFINNEVDDFSVVANTEKKEYETREQVNLELSIPELNDDETWARISVAVVSENMFGVHGNLQNIKSYLLLDSELKGQVQTPGLYFVDDDSVSSTRKLDLLMLTNGWSSYLWTNRNEKGNVEIPNASSGLVFDGKVKKIMSGKPYVGSNVFLSCNNEEFKKVEFTKTDANGYFRFDSIFFLDTASVVVQAKNYNNKTKTQLEMHTFGMQHATVDRADYEHIDDIGELSFGSYKLKYLNELALAEFFPDRESKLIEEVKVVGEKQEEIPDNHFRIYSPSATKKLSDIDRSRYPDVFHYIGGGRFSGVRVGYANQISGAEISTATNGNVVIIRGAPASLYLLDGFPVSPDDLYDVPMGNVDVVDIVKGPDTAIFGMKGMGGVVSVFTCNAGNIEPEDEFLPGTLVERILGFERFRAFYNPVYDTINVNSAIPDYRQTLYWNPSVLVNGNDESVSFFTCDNLSNYKVLVEGLTNSGKICLGETGFVVNKRR